MEQKKPRVKFCWLCGKKLWGNHFAEREIPYQEGIVVMHKECAKDYDRENTDYHRGTY